MATANLLDSVEKKSRVISPALMMNTSLEAPTPKIDTSMMEKRPDTGDMYNNPRAKSRGLATDLNQQFDVSMPSS